MRCLRKTGLPEVPSRASPAVRRGRRGWSLGRTLFPPKNRVESSPTGSRGQVRVPEALERLGGSARSERGRHAVAFWLFTVRTVSTDRYRFGLMTCLLLSSDTVSA
eukprot:5411317-Prymnesium_polylepis.1